MTFLEFLKSYQTTKHSEIGSDDDDDDDLPRLRLERNDILDCSFCGQLWGKPRFYLTTRTMICFRCLRQITEMADHFKTRRLQRIQDWQHRIDNIHPLIIEIGLHPSRILQTHQLVWD